MVSYTLTHLLDLLELITLQIILVLRCATYKFMRFTRTTNSTSNFSFKMCNYTIAFLRSIRKNIKDRFQQLPIKSYLDVQDCGIRTKETTEG